MIIKSLKLNIESMMTASHTLFLDYCIEIDFNY
jgi:hypothetical protein